LSRGEKRGVKISPRKWMRSRPSWRSREMGEETRVRLGLEWKAHYSLATR
jgi:hypothetical protein